MTIGDLYNANNVVVGQAAAYFAPMDTALPALTGWNTADPFDDTFWTTGGGDDPVWTPCGATDQGWTFGADKSTQQVTIEEQSTPVATTLTSQSISLAASLSEDITKTLALSLNATAASTAADGTTAGYDLLTLQDTPILYAAALVTVNAEGFGRIIYAPRWSQLNNVSAAFRRAADKRMYGVQFSTVCNTDQIQVINFTAAKTVTTP